MAAADSRGSSRSMRQTRHTGAPPAPLAGAPHAERIYISPYDTYENVDLQRGSFNDARDRVLVSRDDVFRGRTAAMLILGQSNAANSGAAPHVPARRVFNFNLFDGNCYLAKDPLLGATESRGNFATRMADML